MAHRPAHSDDYVFPDGQTFKNVRDSVVAAALANMWHVAYDIARRYNVQDMICIKCGKADARQQNHTYFTYRDHAIRICSKCRGNNITLPR